MEISISRVTVWHHKTLPSDAKPWPERWKFLAVPNNCDKILFLAYHLFIYSHFSCDKMHTVHRFCHNLSQVFTFCMCVLLQPRLSHGTKNRLLQLLKNLINVCRPNIYFLLQKLAIKANVLLEQTAQVLIWLHLGKQPNLTITNAHNVQLFLDVVLMSPEPRYKKKGIILLERTAWALSRLYSFHSNWRVNNAQHDTDLSWCCQISLDTGNWSHDQSRLTPPRIRRKYSEWVKIAEHLVMYGRKNIPPAKCCKSYDFESKAFL